MTTATRAAECRFCGVALHRIPDAAADEFAWAGPDGLSFGPDPDLPPDPYGHLAALAVDSSMTAMREYASLKVRLDMGGTIHTHQPRDETPPHTGPLPWHCGWPGWLRPSGWCCRQCGRRLLPIAGAP